MRILLEVVSAAGLALLVGLLPVYWGGLPERAPMHFDIAGKPDGWGPRSALWFLTALGIALYALLTLCARCPQWMNLPFEVSSESRPRQVKLAQFLVSWLKALIMALFAWILWSQIQTALGNSRGLGAWFAPVFLASVFGTLVVYFIAAWKAR